MDFQLISNHLQPFAQLIDTLNNTISRQADPFIRVYLRSSVDIILVISN
jgi:hypothetical protein